MKKLLLFLTVFLTATVGFAHLPVEQLNYTVTRAVAQEDQPSVLYRFVASSLQDYYQREDFTDPQHKTGWSRVDNFLKWLKTNERGLMASRVRIYYVPFPSQMPAFYDYSLTDLLEIQSNKPFMTRVFWAYLGIRYLAEIYKQDLDFSSFTVTVTDMSVQTGVMAGNLVLRADENESLPSAVNLGMHEGTHCLPLLIDNAKSGELNELATFYTEYNYGLPVKKEDSRNFAISIRDVRRVHAFFPNRPIYREYNSFIAGLILNSSFTPAKVLTLQDTEDFNSGLSLWEVAVSLMAAKNNRFMMMKDPSRTAPEHYLMVEEDKLPDVAQRFGFSDEEVQQWKSSPALFTDLGDIRWDENAADTEAVVLQKHAGKFIFIGKLTRVNAQKFLRLNFGDLADTPALQRFYERLFAYLPQPLLQAIEAQFPTVVEYFYQVNGVKEKLLLPYEKEWNEAIIRALKDTTKQKTVLPDGYL